MAAFNGLVDKFQAADVRVSSQSEHIDAVPCNDRDCMVMKRVRKRMEATSAHYSPVMQHKKVHVRPRCQYGPPGRSPGHARGRGQCRYPPLSCQDLAGLGGRAREDEGVALSAPARLRRCVFLAMRSSSLLRCSLMVAGYCIQLWSGCARHHSHGQRERGVRTWW